MDGTGPKPRSHVFGFIDETGLLHSARTDRIFALGLLLSQNTRELHRAIINLKNRRNYHREFKFTDITSQNFLIYKELVDIFFNCTNNRFHCLIVDKNNFHTIRNEKSHTSYNKLAASLIADSIDYKRSRASEYITVLADDISASKDDRFEKIIRDTVKKKHRRNALFGIARLESHAVSEIQMTDVLLGLVAYSYKIRLGAAKGSGAKLRLLKHLQRKLATSELSHEQSIKLARGEIFQVTENN
jgi:hypothetical protein